ncbi:hypothetical protein PY257_14380, partial [Ramlibacter sp. H39-3-26]|nr:hypothetical protein [Ramlibacter sp. H39-3-26]
AALVEESASAAISLREQAAQMEDAVRVFRLPHDQHAAAQAWLPPAQAQPGALAVPALRTAAT